MRRSDPLGLLMAAAATAAVVTMLAVGSTQDEEELRFAVLSTWLFADALRHGSVALWTPLLGFGVPQPFTPNFNFHPLMPLLGLLSPVEWVRLLLASHAVLGAAGMWRLAGRLQIGGVTRGACVCTYLLATPVLNYALTDLWLTHFVVWTSAPWLTLAGWRLLEAEGRARAFWAVVCGLAGGLVLGSTNPGHAAAYWLVLLAIAIAHWRRIGSRLPWIAVAVAIVLAIAGPGLAQLAHERGLFDPELPLDILNAPLGAAAMASAFLSPYWTLDEDTIFSRTLFMGGPFLGLALVSAVRFARQYRQLAIVCLGCFLLLFTPLLPLPIVSARFHYRDPLIIAATLLAGVMLEQMWRAARWRPLAALAIVAQLGVLVAAAWPVLTRSLMPEAAAEMWWRGGSGDGPAADAVRAMVTRPGRVLLGPVVEEEIYQRQRFADGLGVNALAYRGVPVVNGWFKGVSSATIWPDHRMFYGRILSPASLLQSSASLDVFGIRYVLANEGEAVSERLERRAVIQKRGGGDPLVVYENPAAWPGAFMLDGAAEVDLPTLPDCPTDRLMCRDATTLLERAAPGNAVMQQQGRAIVVSFAAAPRPRMLVVTQMYREDWTASGAGGPLAVRPVLGGFIGVEVPPQAGDVRLEYRPITVMVATGVAAIAVAGSVVFLAVTRRRRDVERVERAGTS